MQETNPLRVVDDMLTGAVHRGLLHRMPEEDTLDGHTIRLDGRDLVQFGSCSYLALELDPRLKEGARVAAEQVGVCFSSSRAYVSAPLYRTFEGLAERIFGGEVLVTPTTTLGHLSAIPVLCEPGDAIILDHQAHQSLHMAATLARSAGTRVELVRHDRIDLVQELFEELRKDHHRVWFATDGVYSMYGDLAPVAELAAMLDRHEQFHLYIDDAHGMSWCGVHGRGYTLDNAPLHERMVVATSFVKGFAAAGAALVFANPEWKRLVQTCGGPMIFSGPVSPLALGAGIASAEIHLSAEIERRQQELRDRIRLCNSLLLERGLPLVAETETPIRFVGTGSPRAAQGLTSALMGDGFFTNVSHFPAVPMRRAGVRFTLTLHHSEADIRALVSAIDRRLPEVLAEEGLGIDDVYQAFRMTSRKPAVAHEPAPLRLVSTPATTAAAHLEHFESIEDVDPTVWDFCLGDRGSFTWQGMRFLERTFRGNVDACNNWKFHYYLVREASGRPLLATFFTESIWKHDMLASAAVSERAEARRQSDPEFLTSAVFSMGCLLTEGDHLYLDRMGDWRGALSALLMGVKDHADACDARMLVLRDLPSGDDELDEWIVRHGYVANKMPESMRVDMTWSDDAAFLGSLSKKFRYHQRHEVLPWNDAYDVDVLGAVGGASAGLAGAGELAHFHQLYQNVKAQSLDLNTFDLPASFFEQALSDPGWELIRLRLRPECGGDPESLGDAIVASAVGPHHYSPMVIGMDYRWVRSHGLYRQCIRHTLLRARELGLSRVLLGMGASLEKRRFGATGRSHTLYMQAEDHYYFDVLTALSAETHL